MLCKHRKQPNAFALGFFQRCVPQADVMCSTCVMFPLEVKCAFGTCYGTHCITVNEVSNITMRSITSLWRSQTSLNYSKVLSFFGGAFHVFRGKRHTLFTIAPFPRPYGLEPSTLWDYIEIIKFFDIINPRKAVV